MIPRASAAAASAVLLVLGCGEQHSPDDPGASNEPMDGGAGRAGSAAGSAARAGEGGAGISGSGAGTGAGGCSGPGGICNEFPWYPLDCDALPRPCATRDCYECARNACCDELNRCGSALGATAPASLGCEAYLDNTGACLEDNIGASASEVTTDMVLECVRRAGRFLTEEGPLSEQEWMDVEPEFSAAATCFHLTRAGATRDDDTSCDADAGAEDADAGAGEPLDPCAALCGSDLP